MEIPETKVFEREVEKQFEFLVDDFSFSGPVFLSSKEKYSDRVVYSRDDTAVEVLNAWHPADYGFEVNYYSDKTVLETAGSNAAAREIIYFRLKEQQDGEMTFIRDGALTLKGYLVSRETPPTSA